MTASNEWRKDLSVLALNKSKGSHGNADSKTVAQIMARPVFTVCATDTIERAADLMEWKHIRHVPVEDEEGYLVGVVTYRTLLHLLGLCRNAPVSVGEVMKALPVTVFPETPLLKAMLLMKDGEIGCLPVVDPKVRSGPKLVGIITGSDFISLSAELLEDWLKN